MKHLLCATVLVISSHHLLAHELHARLDKTPLTVITLTYADGKPFAYEQFEVMPQGSDTPSQVGRTDARGRAAILPLPDQDLVVTATSKDGHGTRLTLAASKEDLASHEEVAPLPRWMKLLTGAGLLFGLFGLLQLFNRSRKSSP